VDKERGIGGCEEEPEIADNTGNCENTEGSRDGIRNKVTLGRKGQRPRPRLAFPPLEFHLSSKNGVGRSIKHVTNKPNGNPALMYVYFIFHFFYAINQEK